MPKSNSLSKKQVVAPAIVAALALMMAPMLTQGAFAAPKLHGPVSCSSFGDNQLRCTLEVSGLGGAETATAHLESKVTVVTGCINQGENEPQGLKRSTTTGTADQTVNVQGGKAVFTLTTDPLNAENLRNCPSDNMTPTITCVSFGTSTIDVTTSSGQKGTFTGNSVGSCPTTRK